VLYIDTDTSFTAYLLAGFILRDENNLLDPKNYPYSTLDSQNNDNDAGTDERSKDITSSDNHNRNGHYGVSCSARLIDSYLPSEGRFESLLGQVIASMPKASVVILDSINSFYNMYPTSYVESRQPIKLHDSNKQLDNQVGKQNDTFGAAARAHVATPSIRDIEKRESEKTGYTISRLNHLLSIFIMLLVKHGIYLNIPVLVTSMVRYKKVSEDLWIKSPACRRLLLQKSVVRLSVEMTAEKDLSVNIMKHPSIAQQTVVFTNAGIHSAFEVDQGKP
jgi:hypothetical protein